MELNRRLWVVAAVLGVTGCGGEGIPPSPSGPSSSPAVKSTTAPSGPGMGSAVQPGPSAPKTPETGKADAGKTEASRSEPGKATSKEHAGSNDAPPLEAPKTGSTDAAPAAKLTDEQLAGINKLPEAERAAAIKQAVCPVSGEGLGSMGKPIKVSAEGRTFYLCCDGCEDKVKSDPKGVVAKLDKK